MTDWTPIDPITEFVVGKAITFEHGRLWYNNPIAIAEGADGAPRISRRAIQPGGAEIDGAFGDGDTAPTAGASELTGINLTVPKTFPFISMIRVNGDVSLSSTLTISTATDAQRTAAELIAAIIGRPGAEAINTTIHTGSGAGSIGAGGVGSPNSFSILAPGGTGRNAALLRRIWLSRLPILGGKGGPASATPGGDGGGALILVVNGNCDFTGGTIDANGANGASSGSHQSGGAGGGSIIVICTGTITNGTFNAKGGNGAVSGGSRAGAGGGGYIGLVASDFIGSQVLSVAGGTTTAPGGAGAAGATETETLTEAEINGILLR